MFGVRRRYIDYILSDDPEHSSYSDSMESMDDVPTANETRNSSQPVRPVRSIRMHNLEKTRKLEKPQFLEKFRKLEKPQFLEKPRNLSQTPEKIRNFTQTESEYLFLIKSDRLNEIHQLRTLKNRRSFQKASRTYLMSCLLTLGSVVENARPANRSNHSLNSLLEFLKLHKLRVLLRMNSRDFRRIFTISKQEQLLNRLLNSPQIKLMTTMQTPKLLWRRSKFSFVRFWKLNLPLSVTKPRRPDHVLRGIDKDLFEKIARSRPLVLCSLLKRPEINSQLGIEWRDNFYKEYITHF